MCFALWHGFSATPLLGCTCYLQTHSVDCNRAKWPRHAPHFPAPTPQFPQKNKSGSRREWRVSHTRRVKTMCFVFFPASAGTVTFALKRTSRPVLGSLLARECVYNAELSGRPVSIRFRMVAELDSLLTCPAREGTRAWSSTPSGGWGGLSVQWRTRTTKYSLYLQKVCSKSHCSALNV